MEWDKAFNQNTHIGWLVLLIGMAEVKTVKKKAGRRKIRFRLVRLNKEKKHEMEELEVDFIKYIEHKKKQSIERIRIKRKEVDYAEALTEMQ